LTTEFPKRYNFKEIEEKWRTKWEEMKIYYFDREDRTKPTFSINTPPPYPSGEFHVGNAFNHTYIDFVARYKRMRGYNVLFPQGWDCHGLPTEVRVEKTLGKSKSEIPPEEFLKLCREFTLKCIEPMKEAIRSLGCSIDWSYKYKTMDPDYWRRTQLSFILMYKKGLIYKGTLPVNWCPRCETAIAEAEVEYKEVTRPLYFYDFILEDGRRVTIASTRPELLASCVAVAVNPDDDRYKDLIGKKIKVPIYDRFVPIIAEPEVDPEFGTGIVMVCTYGDKSDVRWQIKHNLPFIQSINEKGIMTKEAGPLEGLSIKEAREKIVELLKQEGYLKKIEQTVSSIGTCWRCHTPVEILPKEQWFVKTKQLADKVIEEARKIKWVPPYAYKRLEDWVNSLDWDWPISRQRLFATPIPVYYCKDCGYTIVAEEDWVPIDPRKDPLPIGKCPKCGSQNIIGENNVLDTWMDSSITAAVHAGWPDNLDERLFPADLQPNGYDIIRTWDYYLITRGIALFGKTQFKIALINGMVRGTDGRMMHKSYGNYVSLREVIDKYGADAYRLWVASSAATGSDIRFSWENLKYTQRFLTKLWNAARFIWLFTKEYDFNLSSSNIKFKDVDRWIINLLNKLIEEVTNALEEFDFIAASTRIIDFTWHVFCDHYIEAVKYRVSQDNEYSEAAKWTLNYVLLRIIQLLAVFSPHICEELYYRIFHEKIKWRSITTSEWPKYEPYNEQEVKRGDIIISVIASMRRAKHDMRIPLNEELSKAIIYVNEEMKNIVEDNIDDIKGTLRIKEIEIATSGEGEAKVEEYPDVSFTIVK